MIRAGTISALFLASLATGCGNTPLNGDKQGSAMHETHSSHAITTTPDQADCTNARPGVVSVIAPRVRRPAVPSAPTAAYGTLCNLTSADITLTGVSASFARSAELHETTRSDSGIVSMAPRAEIPVKAGNGVLFQPGGLHVMIFGAKLDEESGLTLSFAQQDGPAIETPVMVEDLAADAAADHSGH
ncbi:MAG: copper chaperone PCu(A)C [Pseudomonadota bacterium]